MSREPLRPEPAPDEAELWLDGLAGREGQGRAHAEGQRLREALLPEALSPEAPVAMPQWAELERRAAESTGAASSTSPNTARRQAEAANQSQWRPWHGMAAAIALGTVLVATIWPSPKEESLRGVAASAPSTEAVWRTAEPQGAAEALATELRSVGAQVDLHSDAAGIRLLIAVPPAAIAAVNQHLSTLETAVDAQGRLSLRVLAP